MLTSARDLVIVSRPKKALPVALLPAVGVFYARDFSWPFLLAAIVSLSASMLIATQLNVLSDREQDRRTRPELFASAQRLSRALARVIAVELALVLAIALLFFTKERALISALQVGICCAGVAYSYFPGGGLKRYWWSHALLFIFGYWAGVISGALAPSLTAPACALGTSMALADYSIYLGEAAIDHGDDKARGLRVLWVLWSATAAACAGLVGVAAAAVLAVVVDEPLRGALVLGCIVRAIFLMGCLTRHGDSVRARFADAVFVGARVIALVGVLVGRDG